MYPWTRVLCSLVLLAMAHSVFGQQQSDRDEIKARLDQRPAPFVNSGREKSPIIETDQVLPRPAGTVVPALAFADHPATPHEVVPDGLTCPCRGRAPDRLIVPPLVPLANRNFAR